MTIFQNFCRRSQLFQPMQMIPKDVLEKQETVSKTYKLFLQFGIIRRSDIGMYAFLPLGMRVLNKTVALVNIEMAKIGAQSILLPSLTPSKLWKKTNRYANAKSELFTLLDRHNKEYILSPTHEETITNIISELGILPSTVLPLRLYQISSKWRDEMKPRIGFLRSREFVMKDLYTFDKNLVDAKNAYELVCDAYRNFFEEIGIDYVKVIGEPDDIGGIMSHEYHYLSNIGEDILLLCSSCQYHTKPSSGELNCPHCNNVLTEHKSVEVGHAFLLDTKYSEPLNAKCRFENTLADLVMGCYGLGLSRIITAAAEVLSTNNELRWPKCLAPYTVCIIPPKKGSKEESASKLVDHIQSMLSPLNIDMILDDRTEMTIGKRFLQAQQVGYPYIVVIGKHAIESPPLIEVHSLNDSSFHKMTVKDINDYFTYMDEKKEGKKDSTVI